MTLQADSVAESLNLRRRQEADAAVEARDVVAPMASGGESDISGSAAPRSEERGDGTLVTDPVLRVASVAQLLELGQRVLRELAERGAAGRPGTDVG